MSTKGFFTAIGNSYRSYILPFIKTRPGIAFSVVFFGLVLLLYVFNFKNHDEVSDNAFVKTTIEQTEPRAQLNYINKLLRNEEFTVNTQFFTKSINVIPNNIGDQIKRLSIVNYGNTFSLTDNDTTHFFYNSDSWLRVAVHIHDIAPIALYSSGSLNDVPNLNYDRNSLMLNYDVAGHVIIWYPGATDYERQKFLPFTEIAGANNKSTLFYFNHAVATFDLNFHEIRIYYDKSDYEHQSDTARFRTIKIRSGLHDIQEFNDGLMLHFFKDGQHSFCYADAENLQGLTDAIPNEIRITGTNQILNWEKVNNLLLVYPLDGSILVINGKTPGAVVKLVSPKKLGPLEIGVELIGYNQNFIWLRGKMSDGDITYIRIDLKKVDKFKSGKHEVTFDAFKAPNHDLSVDEYLSPSVNDDGITLYRDSTIQNMLFFKCSNTDSVFKTISPYKLLDSSLVKDLGGFNIQAPSNTPEFQLIASSRSGIGITYQIIPSSTGKPKLATVMDKGSNNPLAIVWPDRPFFITESIPDYFFMVLLIISVFVLYFLGLFYVMDWRNRGSQPDDMNEFVPEIKKLKYLTDKLAITGKSMRSLKLRSEIMLWLGIVIGVAGMIAFVVSLHAFFQDTEDLKFNAQFTMRMLRTFGIFSFMEVFSFYFLKQYRITFNEYKRFYSVYLKITNYFEYIELANLFPEATDKKDSFAAIKDAILKDVFSLHEEGIMEKFNEFDKSVAGDIIKTLSEKIPGGK